MFPDFLTFQIEVDGRNRNAAFFKDMDRRFHLLEIIRIDNLNPIHSRNLGCQLQPSSQVNGSMVFVETVSHFSEHGNHDGMF